MADIITDQVIEFTANYTGNPPNSIDTSTTLESIGISSGQDSMTYLMELEDNFQLTYENGDADGIVTVGNAADLIKRKLGQ